MNSRFSGLLWIKRGVDLADVHEHVKSMVIPDLASLTESHKVPYIPAAAVGAVLGKLTGFGIGSMKRSPWTHELQWKPSWHGSGWGYTLGGAAGAGLGVLTAAVINRVREHRKEKAKGDSV